MDGTVRRTNLGPSVARMDPGQDDHIDPQRVSGGRDRGQPPNLGSADISDRGTSADAGNVADSRHLTLPQRMQVQSPFIAVHLS